MDEEQGLSSPLAGGIRGIRRSVSSSIFTGRAVPPPAPDPQVTSLLNQNSLTLSTVSGQLTNISAQVSGLNSSLLSIRENLAVSDQLERQREQEKAKRDAILAEQALREGKESDLEKKIQFALLTPVRKVSRFAQGILGRLGNFLLFLAGGWLVDKTLTLIRLTSEGNIDKLNEFKSKFLGNLLLLGGIAVGLTVGVGKVVATIGRLSSLALKIAFSGLIRKPFSAAINFLRKAVVDFSKFALQQVGKIFTKGPGTLLKVFKPLLPVGILGAVPFSKQILNFLKSPFGKKTVTESVEQTAKAGTKTGARGIFKSIPYVGTLVDLVYGYFDYQDRRKDKDGDGVPDQTKKEAGMGAGGATLGGLIGFLTAATLIPEPISSAIGGFGLALIGLVLGTGGMALGGKVGDELSGLNKRKRENLKENQSSNDDKVSSVETYSSGNISMGLNTDGSNSITPINLKKELNVASAISNTDETPEITYLPMGGAVNTGVPSGGTGSSQRPSDSLPTIPSSDFANTSIALSESIFNVVV
tara:strand:- start:829 stop:2415 length:1587 start_codon:yes stop_codon:yes gene_type:complete